MLHFVFENFWFIMVILKTIFPKDYVLCKNWLSAIPRENCHPTKNRVQEEV